MGRLKAILRVLNANLGTCNFAHIMQICVHNANLCAMQFCVHNAILRVMQICERAIYMRAILRTMQFCAYINFIHVYVCVYVYACTCTCTCTCVRVYARVIIPICAKCNIIGLQSPTRARLVLYARYATVRP